MFNSGSWNMEILENYLSDWDCVPACNHNRNEWKMNVESVKNISWIVCPDIKVQSKKSENFVDKFCIIADAVITIQV